MDVCDKVTFGRFEWRPGQRLLLDGGQPAPLKGRALDVLDVLVAARDRVVTKDELLDRVWGQTVVEEANLHVQVSALRKVLGPGTISTVAGRGYRFTAPIDHAAPAPPAPGVVEHAPPHLIGRDDEFVALTGLVVAHRLVTLVGPGGMGKTRLAQAAAAALAKRWASGVAWVELAAVLDPAQLPQALALALGLPPGDHRSGAALAAALHQEQRLVVLDNCEHVVEAAAAVAREMRSAPGIHLLVTSQEPLNVPDERLLRLQPLTLPAPGEAADVRFGAVNLFVERARSRDSAFAMDAGNAQAVGDICRALDGVPLAIELAAARVHQLGVQALRARLDDRLRLLVGSTRDVRPQHRTLRAALEWSHGLLLPAEQVVLRRLGVFVGGFTLELAQQVAADDGAGAAGENAGLDAWAVLDALGALVDRSMVVRGTGEPIRFRLLETVRLYALEQLSRHTELARWRERHAQAVAALFTAVEGSPGVGAALHPADPLRAALPEVDNARAAIEWALQSNAHRLAIELIGAAAGAFIRVGAIHELLPAMQSLLPHLDAAPLAAQAALLRRLGSQARQFGMARDEVRRIKALGLERARAAGVRQALHAALASYGWTLAADGERDAAQRLLDEAIGLERQDDPPSLRVPRLGLQLKLSQLDGNVEAGIAASYEAVATLEHIPSGAAALAIESANLRGYLCAAGRFDEAVAVGRRSLSRAGRSPPALLEILSMVMPLAATGAVDEAEALLRGRSAEIERHPNTVIQYGLEGLAMLAAARGRFDDALHLLAEQQRRRDLEDKPFDSLTLAARERVLERCRTGGSDGPVGRAPWQLPGALLDGAGLLRLGLGTRA